MFRRSHSSSQGDVKVGNTKVPSRISPLQVKPASSDRNVDYLETAKSISISLGDLAPIIESKERVPLTLDSSAELIRDQAKSLREDNIELMGEIHEIDIKLEEAFSRISHDVIEREFSSSELRKIRSNDSGTSYQQKAPVVRYNNIEKKYLEMLSAITQMNRARSDTWTGAIKHLIDNETDAIRGKLHVVTKIIDLHSSFVFNLSLYMRLCEGGCKLLKFLQDTPAKELLDDPKFTIFSNVIEQINYGIAVLRQENEKLQTEIALHMQGISIHDVNVKFQSLAKEIDKLQSASASEQARKEVWGLLKKAHTDLVRILASVNNINNLTISPLFNLTNGISMVEDKLIVPNKKLEMVKQAKVNRAAREQHGLQARSRVKAASDVIPEQRPAIGLKV